jgi:hypothetical protein
MVIFTILILPTCSANLWISKDLLQFPSSPCNHFHCKGLSLSCLGLSLCALEIFPEFFSLYVHYWHIQKILTFYVSFTTCYFDESASQLSFLVQYLGSLKYRIILSVNRNNFTFSFYIHIPLISFSSILLFLRIKIVYKIRMDRVDTFVSFLILQEVFQFFPNSLLCWL